ncbi:MAG: hypothetical protein AAF493_12195 [Pseudomonadota bacterium]
MRRTEHDDISYWFVERAGATTLNLKVWRLTWLGVTWLCVTNAWAQQVPIDLYESFAGDLNYVVTGGSLRSAPNSGTGADPCAVGTSSTNPLGGIPAGSTIVRAYLYWAGSYSTAGGSTQTTPDLTVSLNGDVVPATRSFLLGFPFGATTYPYCSWRYPYSRQSW